MKEFSKKTTIIFQAVSLAVLLLSFVGIIVVFTNLPELKAFL